MTQVSHAGEDESYDRRQWIPTGHASFWPPSVRGSSERSRDTGTRTPAGSPTTRAPGDVASDLYQDELDEGLSDDLREQLAAVERAEARLAAGTYGLSIESGQPIPDERLEAFPTAERTTEEESSR